MIEVKIDVRLGGLLADLDRLQSDVRERAAVSAVNKTLAKAQTNMIRAISREFNVSAGYVRDRLNIARAKFAGGRAFIAGALQATGAKKRSANLIAFVEKSVTLAQAKKRAKAGTLDQLHFRIKRQGKMVVIPGAFIANKGRTVFIREGKSRLPIKALQTIDVPQMFNTKRLNKVVVDAIDKDFPGIFANEMKFFVDRFNRGRAR
jgi:hypothetical protein